jgi:hypothetical protein
VKNKNLRKEMIWASFLGMPFGFIDFFLVPTYWHPDSLFNLIEKYGVGIESFMFLFFMSGIVSVIYQSIWRKKMEKISGQKQPHLWLVFFAIVAFVGMSVLFPTKAIYNLMLVGALGATFIAYLRRDLAKQILISAFVFGFFYFGVFILINLIFPGFVEYSYNLKNTWGILILGVPLEEIGVAFFSGAFWCTLYEYTRSYRGRMIV